MIDLTVGNELRRRHYSLAVRAVIQPSERGQRQNEHSENRNKRRIQHELRVAEKVQHIQQNKCNISGDHSCAGALDIPVDLPRGSDHVRDGREIIVMHDYIGGFIGAAGGIAGHRNSNVGLLNRLGILGTGACHGDYLAVLAELLNYIQLLRSYTGVDICVKLQFVAVLHGLRNALSGDCLT